MNIIDSLKWRAAIKKYDAAKKVSETDIETLIEAGNLAATSVGLQPFKLIVIKDQELKNQLTKASRDQPQVADASHLFVFAVHTQIDEPLIDAYFHRMAEVRNVSIESLDDYRNMVKGFLLTWDDETKTAWATKQAYIALGTVLSAAAAIQVDTTPMEGFDPIQYQQILGLESKGLLPVVILPVGYRSAEDVYAKMPKVRKKRNDFVMEIN
ncbi:hypothetical protein BKI52_30485 [marine bacterium AO1-C]|nr:hypothetical protein BKI52_30485 [marine bacterium AO1-C]